MKRVILCRFIIYLTFLISCLLTFLNLSFPFRHDWVYQFYAIFSPIYIIFIFFKLKSIIFNFIKGFLITIITYLIMMIYFKYTYFGIEDFMVIGVITYFFTGVFILNIIESIAILLLNKLIRKSVE
ncbi:hypothetical protein A6A20_11320 [Volucribacter amazonae]|uniref:Uncharacterized protein n=1 Tax=Volucribacter amazonae TaxID=256731 RepID=A0A9X4SMJ0_9PAST|nr:hypothetical protein [Volucribacter amazonae]